MKMKKCMGCMRDYEESNSRCPVCGYSQKQTETDVERFPEILRPATILGDRYIMGRHLSCSDFSTVYIAWDALLKKRVAVKEYFPFGLCGRGGENRVECGSTQDRAVFEKGMQFFEEEAKILGENQDIKEIVEVYRCVRANDTSYMIMEYMEGCTLEDWMEGSVSIKDLSVNDVFRRLMLSVDTIHDRGIGHYNLSPDNIYVNEEGEIRLLDFGRAKKECLKSMGGDAGLFDEYYTAPEVLQGDTADKNADLYSLGTIYYSLLTGKRPPESLKRLKRKSRLRVKGPEHEQKINLLAEISPDKRPESIKQFWKMSSQEGESS